MIALLCAGLEHPVAEVLAKNSQTQLVAFESRFPRNPRLRTRLPVLLLVERKQGAQPHPAESRSKTRPTRSRREFCLFVNPAVSS
jgi:hypothetical protein